MNKKRQVILLVLSVVIFSVTSLALTYALFTFSAKGEKLNTISTGIIAMSFKETSNKITIDKALPTTDATGKVRLKEGEYFDFTVESNIKGEAIINYEIAAEDITTSDKKIDGKYIKLYLTKLDSSDTETEVMAPKVFKVEKTANELTGRPLNMMSLAKKSINSSETVKYRLRMYVDESYNPQDDGGNLSFSVRINVYGKVSNGMDYKSEMQKEVVSKYTESGNMDEINTIDLDNMSLDEKKDMFGDIARELSVYKIKGITGKSNAIIYRGGVVNNFVKFGNILWKILQIDEDGNLRLISDDVLLKSTYNDTKEIANVDMAKEVLAYQNSNVKTALQNWYDENLSDYSNMIVDSKFCNDFTTTSLTSPFYFQSYTNIYSPSLVCPSKYTFESKIGLISASEYILAGGSYNKSTNLFYLHNSSITSNWWTLSPSFYNSSSKTGNLMMITTDSTLTDSTTSATELGLRPVITINGNYEMLGDGTKSNPYHYSENDTGSKFSTGEKVELGNNQDFYVISSNSKKTLLLSAYNLNVGNYKNSDVTEGIQDSTIRAWVDSATPNYGRTKYYDTEGDSTSGTTELDTYLSNYKSYLETNLNIVISNVDLLKRSDAINYLGMNSYNTAFSTASPYYSWMTYTTFWFKEESSMNGSVYYLNTQNNVLTANDVSGIRPTIEVSTEVLEKYLNK